jgi:dolichyl-diphosphooligosaccharide--protein glycosyltransferase
LKEKNRWSTPRFYSILYGCAVVGLAVIAILTFVFDMGGLSVRVRSLFLKHTHTGNPLVDSVAEHQPANQGILNHYLQDGIFLAPIGLVYLCNRLNASNYFLITYAVVTYYFCLKMMRLVLLMGGCVSALSAVAVGFTLEWFAVEAAKLFLGHEDEDDEIERIEMEAIAAAKDKKKDDKDKAKTTVPQLAGDAKDAKGKRRASGSSSASTPLSRRERRRSTVDSQTITQLAMEHNKLPKPIKKLLDQWREVPKASRTTLTVAVLAVVMAVFGQKSYNIYNASTQIAPSTSMPQIVFFDHQKGRMVDDYYRSYIWLRDNTPKDSRVLAWWDYGYQINGIAKRTSLADGNTWNHDHIAFVGRCLMSPEKRAHNIIRHVADYVLIWANGNGDDLQKSMHISRITNSVFPDLCKGDKFCNNFGFNQHGPMEDMAKSLVYKLHQNGKNPAVKVHPKLFKEVYESPNGLVRIYKVQNVAEDSKEWIASPESRVCDGGGWYCPGHYPPALGKLFDQKFAGYDHDARKVTNQ